MKKPLILLQPLIGEKIMMTIFIITIISNNLTLYKNLGLIVKYFNFFVSSPQNEVKRQV